MFRITHYDILSTSGKLYIHTHPIHYLSQHIRNDYFSRDFHGTLVHKTAIEFTAPGRMCFAAVKYYTCPTWKIVPESLNMKSSTSWHIFLHRRNQKLQPEKSLWSNRAWSYSSPFTKRPPKYLPFNASRALSASKSKGKINYFWVTTSYTQITVNSKKLYHIYPNARQL